MDLYRPRKAVEKNQGKFSQSLPWFVIKTCGSKLSFYCNIFLSQYLFIAISLYRNIFLSQNLFIEISFYRNIICQNVWCE